jgi:hypothetical protein
MRPVSVFVFAVGFADPGFSLGIQQIDLANGFNPFFTCFAAS